MVAPGDDLLLFVSNVGMLRPYPYPAVLHQ